MRDIVLSPALDSRDSDARPLNRRQTAKLMTRGKVIDAARRLFAQRGYDAATIRDIAREAGMSTGAVFANFQDKSELFDTVLAEDLEKLLAALNSGMDGSAPLPARLASALKAAYAATLDQLPLVQAVVARAWHQPLADALNLRGATAPLSGLIRQQVATAVDAGELRRDTDIDLVTEMVWTAYLSNYRRAAYDGWDVEALGKHVSAQIDLILGTVRAA